MNAGVAFMRQDRKHLERQVADRKTLARLILRARTVLATASKETRTVFYFVAADGVRSTGGGEGTTVGSSVPFCRLACRWDARGNG
jgi:hypothetical protein